MHKKQNSIKNNNIVQGLRPLSNVLPKKVKKILQKKGYNFSNIVDNWGKIVGRSFSDVCYPKKILNGKKMKNSKLVLNVVHGKEIEVEYSKKDIIEKINAFFGYKFISQIILRTIEHDKIKKNVKKNNFKGNFKNQLNKINNLKLRENLSSLIEAFNDKKN